MYHNRECRFSFNLKKFCVLFCLCLLHLKFFFGFQIDSLEEVGEQRCSVFESGGGFAALAGFGVTTATTTVTKVASARVGCSGVETEN